MDKPIICIVGKKHSGKTTFIEQLLPELKVLGISVGSIKHDAHSFEMDVAGKDSWRHGKAGSETVIISSPKQVGIIKKVDRELTLSQLAEDFMADRHLVLAEGFFRSEHPKIEVFRSEAHSLPLCSKANEEEKNLIAVVSDVKVETTKPLFGIDEAKQVAAMIARQYLGWVQSGLWG